jgi:hypothetical protein
MAPAIPVLTEQPLFENTTVYVSLHIRSKPCTDSNPFTSTILLNSCVKAIFVDQPISVAGSGSILQDQRHTERHKEARRQLLSTTIALIAPSRRPAVKRVRQNLQAQRQFFVRRASEPLHSSVVELA